MPFLADYGLFAAKLLTILFLLLAFIAGVFLILSKSKEENFGLKLKVKKLNEHYQEIKELVNTAILSKEQHKKLSKAQKKSAKQKAKLEEIKPRLFVLNFEGDIKASAVHALSELITAVLLTADSHDEVLVRLESGGGLVNAYGLAASQLQRLRDAQIKLTVAVDKVAASGGYMMACVANKILAAPFAIIGSIGVIAQLPNFHRFLEKKDIDFEQITAGEFKRTLTVFGENTDKARAKMQDEVNETQELFKDFIQHHRPQVKLEKAATGEHWFAKRATELELGLVDELKTSDDYLLAAKDTHDIYELHYKIKLSWLKRLGIGVENLLARTVQSV